MTVDHRLALELQQDAAGRQTVVERAFRQPRFLFCPDQPAGAVARVFAVRSRRQQQRHRLAVDALRSRRPAQQTRDRCNVPGNIPENVLDFAKRDF